MTKDESISLQRLQGFTLIEVIAVLAIISILTTIFAPRLLSRDGPTHVRAAAIQMTALLRKARLQAMQKGVSSTFTLDTGNRLARADSTGSSPVTIPPSAEILHEVSSRCSVVDGRVNVVFLADGRSCGSQITLRMDGFAAIVQTDWLSGKSKLTFRGAGS